MLLVRPPIAASTLGSIGDQPSDAVTMLVACTRRSSAPELSFSRPVATTVTAVTSATPMVSASAVTAVRPGLRMALRRASEPAAPPTAADGRPTRLASPRTPRANRPGVAACALSRRAATGAIFVARRAGIIAASTVASVPTSRLTTIVRVATTIPSVGSSAPTAVNRAFRPSASTMPTPMPAADASRPIVSASSSTAPRTWRREAPTIRSSPNSFVRWATVIESELKIVNAPTSTATAANASRIVRRMLTSVSSELNANRSSSAAVRTSVFGPAAPAMSARRPATRMRS